MLSFKLKTLRLLSKVKNSEIAGNARIYPFSRITNSEIQERTYVSYGCIINNCSIGKYCSIAQNVKVGLGMHPVNFVSTSPIFYSLNNPLGKSYSQKQAF